MDAALFDMDGVLVDSERYWHEFEESFVFPEATVGEPPNREAITGMNYREIYDYLDAEYGTDVVREEFVARYDEEAHRIYGDRVVLMDRAPDLFEDLRDRGRAVGVVSSSPRKWIDIVRQRFDLGPVDLVLSAEDIDGPGKPEPHVYEHAAAELGLDPEDCTVVEDSINGVRAAVRSGARCIAYRADHNANLDLSEADVVVDGPMELRAKLLS